MTLTAIKIDNAALARDGYAILPGLVARSWIDDFEREVADFAEPELARLKLKRRHSDALWDLMVHNLDYRKTLFPLLKYLRCVQRIGVEIGTYLEQSGFLAAHGFKIPVIWPVLRADIPGEPSYLLPMHQDYRSTKCARAFRMWIPLRDADPQTGTLCVVPGSHTAGPLPHDDLSNDRLGPSILEQVYDGNPVIELDFKPGDALLFDPFLVHGSVVGKNDRLKFVLLVQVQDLSSLVHPDTTKTGKRAVQLAAENARSLKDEGRTRELLGQSAAKPTG
jgi:hypothetical protein